MLVEVSVVAGNPTDILEKLQERIEEARPRDQVAWAAWTQVRRYRRFLELLSSQYADLSRDFAARPWSIMQDDPSETWSLEEQGRMNEFCDLLQLQIETFYMFAKILLDRIALLIQQHFGPARRLPLTSHDKLVKNLRRYAESHNFGLPSDFLQQAETLKVRISDFRDKNIQHRAWPHVSDGIGFDDRGRITLGKFSKPSVKSEWHYAESLDIAQLLPQLDKYLSSVLSLLCFVPAIVTSLSPLMIRADLDGSKTSVPARKDPGLTCALNDRVLVRVHTPYVPFIVGLRDQRLD